jgi:hypothetical protein
MGGWEKGSGMGVSRPSCLSLLEHDRSGGDGVKGLRDFVVTPRHHIVMPLIKSHRRMRVVTEKRQTPILNFGNPIPMTHLSSVAFHHHVNKLWARR